MLGSIISKFDAEAKSHMERQSLNPFSGSFSRSPSPRLSKDQYGRPVAGSKTEERGQRAKVHILKEILDLCNCIHDLGIYNKENRPHDDSDDEDACDDEIIVSFGEIFQIYTKINDKVVGLLIAAKKRGFIFFEKEILFQRRDDDVLIALIKPISEIRTIIKKELAEHHSPTPFQSREVSPSIIDNLESIQQANKASSKPSTSLSTESGMESANRINNVETTLSCSTETATLTNANSVIVKEEQNSPHMLDSATTVPDHSSESQASSHTPSVIASEMLSITDEIPATTSGDPVIISETLAISNGITGRALETPEDARVTEEKSNEIGECASRTDDSVTEADDESKLSHENITSEIIETLELGKLEELSKEHELSDIGSGNEVNGIVNGIDKQPTADEDKNMMDTLLAGIPRLEITFESEPNGETIDEVTTTNVFVSDEPTEIEIISKTTAPDAEVNTTNSLEFDKVDLEAASNYLDTTQVVSNERADSDQSNISIEPSNNFDEVSATGGVDNVFIDTENEHALTDNLASEEFQNEAIEISFARTDTLQEEQCYIENESPSTTALSKEMIENLSARIFERSSSPDPCDEEVQQILECQMSTCSIVDTNTE